MEEEEKERGDEKRREERRRAEEKRKRRWEWRGRQIFVSAPHVLAVAAADKCSVFLCCQRLLLISVSPPVISYASVSEWKLRVKCIFA